VVLFMMLFGCHPFVALEDATGKEPLNALSVVKAASSGTLRIPPDVLELETSQLATGGSAAGPSSGGIRCAGACRGSEVSCDSCSNSCLSNSSSTASMGTAAGAAAAAGATAPSTQSSGGECGGYTRALVLVRGMLAVDPSQRYTLQQVGISCG
jgi:hypothetical protein